MCTLRMGWGGCWYSGSALHWTCPLHGLFQGAGTDEKTLIEILATRTNAEIRAINEAFKEGKCGRVGPSAAGKQEVPS